MVGEIIMSIFAYEKNTIIVKVSTILKISSNFFIDSVESLLN